MDKDAPLGPIDNYKTGVVLRGDKNATPVLNRAVANASTGLDCKKIAPRQRTQDQITQHGILNPPALGTPVVSPKGDEHGPW